MQNIREGNGNALEEKPVVCAPDDGTPCRERLLNAGVELFAEYGYDGASTRHIAARAGCNIAQISFHFGSKRGLYDAAVRTVHEHMIAIMEGCEDEIDARADNGADGCELYDVLLRHTTRIMERLLVKGYSRARYMLLLRTMLERGDSEELFDNVFDPNLATLQRVARTMNPGVTPERARAASFLLINGVISSLRDFPAFFAHDGATDGFIDSARMLAGMICGGFKAAVMEEGADTD